MGKKNKIRKLTDPRLEEFRPASFSRDLPFCYIVDIDGTTSLMNGRNPYDETEAMKDEPNLAVVHLVHLFLVSKGIKSNDKIIYLTGRNERFREISIEWLKKHGIWNESCILVMRGRDDYRPDTVVKRELYEQHVKDKYNVHVVFEDRDRNVDLFRKELKLPVLQPWYGDY